MAMGHTVGRSAMGMGEGDYGAVVVLLPTIECIFCVFVQKNRKKYW